MSDPEALEIGEVYAPATEAYSLSNTVRLDYYSLWRDARNYVIAIVGKRAKRWPELKATLWALYYEFLPKIERYINDETKPESERQIFTRLVSLMSSSNLDPIQVHDLTESQTMEVYAIMRLIMERNGITKYEPKDSGDWT